MLNNKFLYMKFWRGSMAEQPCYGWKLPAFIAQQRHKAVPWGQFTCSNIHITCNMQLLSGGGGGGGIKMEALQSKLSAHRYSGWCLTQKKDTPALNSPIQSGGSALQLPDGRQTSRSTPSNWKPTSQEYCKVAPGNRSGLRSTEPLTGASRSGHSCWPVGFQYTAREVATAM